MLVNLTASTFSDYAFHSAVAIYLFAMLLHLGEYARGRALSSASASASAKVAAGVGAGGEVAQPEEPAVGSGPDVRAPRPWRERFGRMAVALTILGALVHISSVVLRGIAVHRWPWGNMYEFISAICLMAVLGWLFMLRRTPTLRPIGAFVLLPVEALLFLAGTALYVKAGPVMPALQSYWLSIHVTAISIAAGLLLVAGVVSVMFLLRRHAAPEGRLAGVLERLPSAESLDRTAYRITIFAFPLYTFAIICGAIWAEAAWGRYWGWDPKETAAFVAWVIYAGYLHSRATAGWRTTGAAWVNVAGMAAILFNLFFINLVVTGLHSYAGLG
ncbi:MAG TPA: c-type cytochrome biogenesis protein CcsB [Pseudonocardia sp.]|jgi:cytochrome c-type biogenesis protein CcsB